MGRSFSHSPIDFQSMPTVIKALVGANVAGFLLAQLVGGQVYDLFGLVPSHVWRERWVWQLATYLFIHGTFTHLLFNLFALWMFGMPVESEWGAREFLKYFFICGIGAGLCSVLANPASLRPVIGASGAVYGLLVAFAMLYPDAVVYLYFFVPIKAGHMAILFGLIEFFAVSADPSSGIARFAHLGGMLVGYLYIRWWWIVKIRLKGLWRERFGGAGELASPRPRKRSGPAAAGAPAGETDAMAEVDRILDKISAYGEGSLSEDEREVLRRQAGKKRFDA